MCNDYEQRVAYGDYQQAVRASGLETTSSETAADLSAADDIKIGDFGPVLVVAGNGAELKLMRFGWPAARPKAAPVFNFKSDKRSFKDSRRCVIVCSGFFEFTGSKYPKAKHRFSLKGSPVMGVAGLWSEAEDGELSFTMLTTTPGADIAPYHDRQICVLAPGEWAAWLFLTRPEADLLRPLPAGTLVVETVRAGA
ncbi:MAG: SOS response-associated peptidase [Devosia sp.]